MPNKIQTLFIFSLSLFWSCDSNQVYQEYQKMSGLWLKEQEVKFHFEAPDTVNFYNLYINIRNNNDYKFSNLFLISEFMYPNGKIITDTLEYVMANSDGQFLGTGFTDIKENKLWYKGHIKPFKFPELGNYTFVVQHAMRARDQVSGLDQLEGVLDIGFRIEKKD